MDKIVKSLPNRQQWLYGLLTPEEWAERIEELNEYSQTEIVVSFDKIERMTSGMLRAIADFADALAAESGDVYTVTPGAIRRASRPEELLKSAIDAEWWKDHDHYQRAWDAECESRKAAREADKAE